MNSFDSSYDLQSRYQQLSDESARVMDRFSNLGKFSDAEGSVSNAVIGKANDLCGRMRTITQELKGIEHDPRVTANLLERVHQEVGVDTKVLSQMERVVQLLTLSHVLAPILEDVNVLCGELSAEAFDLEINDHSSFSLSTLHHLFGVNAKLHQIAKAIVESPNLSQFEINQLSQINQLIRSANKSIHDYVDEFVSALNVDLAEAGAQFEKAHQEYTDHPDEVSMNRLADAYNRYFELASKYFELSEAIQQQEKDCREILGTLLESKPFLTNMKEGIGNALSSVVHPLATTKEAYQRLVRVGEGGARDVKEDYAYCGKKYVQTLTQGTAKLEKLCGNVDVKLKRYGNLRANIAVPQQSNSLSEVPSSGESYLTSAKRARVKQQGKLKATLEGSRQNEGMSRTGKMVFGGMIIAAQGIQIYQDMQRTKALFDHLHARDKAVKAQKIMQDPSATANQIAKAHLDVHAETLNPTQKEVILSAADALDQHIQTVKERMVAQELTKAQQSTVGPVSEATQNQILQNVENQVRESMRYFVTTDSTEAKTPIQLMMEPLIALSPPQNPEKLQEFNDAVLNYAEEMVRLAFDQHHENPEQYVSHGFDHSLNVASYMARVAELNQDVFEEVQSKYQITAEEATFVISNLAMLHDVGYPTVGNRGKPVHGITGASSVVPMLSQLDHIIQSPNARVDQLKDDFFNAILFHSADKIETTFSARITTTRGSFLVDSNNIVQVLTRFSDPSSSPTGEPRFAAKIEVSSPEIKIELEQKLAEVKLMRPREDVYGPSIPTIEIAVNPEDFKGRNVDLTQKRDRLIGLEYSKVDLIDEPLKALIRLSDNMDIGASRLSSLQREPAFSEFYRSLGETGPLAETEIALENLDRHVDKLLRQTSDQDVEVLQQDIALKTREVMQKEVHKLNQLNDPSIVVPHIETAEIERINTPQEALLLYKQRLVDAILAKSENKYLSEVTKEQIRDLSSWTDSGTYRHFGGCLPIQDVTLVQISGEGGRLMPTLKVIVNGKEYDRTNRTKVKEFEVDQAMRSHVVEIRVGDYQIWRGSEAFRHITKNGHSFAIEVHSEEGQRKLNFAHTYEMV